MNIRNIISRIAIFSLVLLFYSCAENKFYDLGGYESGTLIFTAVNTAVGEVDSASSSAQDYYYYLPSRDASFSLTAFYPGDYDQNGELRSGDYNIYLDRESMIWAGGYNDIEITFQPTDPEEREATFTMPDGNVLTATAESPTIVWHTDSLIGKDSYGVLQIKGESSYKKGNMECHKVGYLYLNINPDFRFNRYNDKWYISTWTNGQPLDEYAYVKFTAENLMINYDSATSYNQSFSNTIESRQLSFSIPYYDSDNNSGLFNFDLTGNDIYVFEGNDVLFTFYPSEGEESMALNFRTIGLYVALTRENPTFTWHVTRDDIDQLSQYSAANVLGYSKYNYCGINYERSSYINLKFSKDIWYDSANGRFYSRSSYQW